MKPNPCYCGHDCARCVTYLATVRDDEGRFCLSHGCPFRKCCHERGSNSCAECGDSPCPMIEDYQKNM